MMLPTELRLEILSLLVVFPDPVEIRAGLDISTFFALSCTSRKLREEVLDLFFSKNTILIGPVVEDQRNTIFIGPIVENKRFAADKFQPFLARIQHLQIDYDACHYRECRTARFWEGKFVHMDWLKKCTMRLGPSRDWQAALSDVRSVLDQKPRHEHLACVARDYFLDMMEAMKPCELVIKCIDHEGNCGGLEPTTLAMIDQIQKTEGLERQLLTLNAMSQKIRDEYVRKYGES